MGLDSVELLMAIEDYFRIQLPASEAERISTIQNMVDAVAQRLQIEQINSPLKSTVFQALAAELYKFTTEGETVKLESKISNYLNAEIDGRWNEVEASLALKLPKPSNHTPFRHSLFTKILNAISWAPNYHWNDILVDRFVDATCACNYQQLINRETIASKYEIYIMVTAITVEKIGVDYFEVMPEKSFTSDLGVD